MDETRGGGFVFGSLLVCDLGGEIYEGLFDSLLLDVTGAGSSLPCRFRGRATAESLRKPWGRKTGLTVELERKLIEASSHLHPLFQ